jgi:hypothetical protein
MRPLETFLVVGIVVLLALAVFQYQETSALQGQINSLQAEVNGIPNQSAQIYQLQQQINNLQSHFTTTTQASTFKIIALCVNVSQRCPNATGDYVFFLSITNTGPFTIPAGFDNSVSFKGGNGTSRPFSTTFNITITAVPPGGSTMVGLTSWQSAYGAGNQLPFSSGAYIGVNVCVWKTQSCEGKGVTAGS